MSISCFDGTFTISNNNVGISNTSPIALVDSSGNIRCNGTLVLRNGSTHPAWAVNAADNTLTYASCIFGYSNSSNNACELSYRHIGLGNTTNFLGVGFHTNSNILVVQGGGNVGIGTSNPLQKLHISGNTLVTNGNIRVSGLTQVVHRRPVFGIGGMTNGGTYIYTFAAANTPQYLNFCYAPFYYGVPNVQPGATRYFRMYMVYSDNFNNSVVGSPIVLRWAQGWSPGTPTYDFTFTKTYGDISLVSWRRDAFSDNNLIASDGQHSTLQLYVNQAGSNFTYDGSNVRIVISYIELQALDVF